MRNLRVGTKAGMPPSGDGILKMQDYPKIFSQAIVVHTTSMLLKIQKEGKGKVASRKERLNTRTFPWRLLHAAHSLSLLPPAGLGTLFQILRFASARGVREAARQRQLPWFQDTPAVGSCCLVPNSLSPPFSLHLMNPDFPGFCLTSGSTFYNACQIPGTPRFSQLPCLALRFPPRLPLAHLAWSLILWPVMPQLSVALVEYPLAQQLKP